MVLKISHSVFLFICLVLAPTNGPLLDQYEIRILKELTKTFDQEIVQSNLREIDISMSNIEVYQMKSHSNLKGFLFIKEVMACSLNGCVSKELLKNNVGSEYYDIAVITDHTFNILSIKVLDYFSDYGYEITSKRYLKQYTGKKLCQFSPEMNTVDGISGATISYNALIGSLKECCKIQNEVQSN